METNIWTMDGPKKHIIRHRFDALTELGAFMRTEFLCISVLRVASGPRVVS